MYVQEFVDIKPPAEEEKEKDHPLSRKENSKWNNFFNDLELWGEVEKDTTRTRSEMHLFQSVVPQDRNTFRLQKSRDTGCCRNQRWSRKIGWPTRLIVT